jgi:hypothetical protein
MVDCFKAVVFDVLPKSVFTLLFSRKHQNQVHWPLDQLFCTITKAGKVLAATPRPTPNRQCYAIVESRERLLLIPTGVKVYWYIHIVHFTISCLQSAYLS